MARPPRIDYPGARHHVMNRGARRAAIFGEAWQGELFLQVLAELPERFGVRILAYAIMPNHFHLLLECPHGNLSRAMKYLGAEFTQRMNRCQQWDGPVFRGRFKSRPVDADDYLAHLFAYIHLNPVKAGLASHADAAPWTSHRALLGLDRAPSWLHSQALLTAFGTLGRYRRYLADVLTEGAAPASWDATHLWKPPGAPPRIAPPPPKPDVEEILAEVAAVAGVPVRSLPATVRGRTGNPGRLLAAWWLQRRTTLSHTEIGGVLGCSAARTSQMVRRVDCAEGELALLRARLLAPEPMLLAEPPPPPYRPESGTFLNETPEGTSCSLRLHPPRSYKIRQEKHASPAGAGPGLRWVLLPPISIRARQPR